MTWPIQKASLVGRKINGRVVMLRDRAVGQYRGTGKAAPTVRGNAVLSKTVAERLDPARRQ